METPWGCLEGEQPKSKAAYGWTAEEREGQKGGGGLNGSVRSLGSFLKNREAGVTCSHLEFY